MILTNKIVYVCVCDNHCKLMNTEVSIINLLSSNIREVPQINIIFLFWTTYYN